MIVIGSDHGGYELKEFLKTHLAEKGIPFVDIGCNGEPCDYPDYAKMAAAKIASGECDKGILCCGAGIGISMAANKCPGIRAALVSEPVSARLAMEHNKANVLCFGGRIIGKLLAAESVDAWLSATFQGGRHTRRVEKIEG